MKNYLIIGASDGIGLSLAQKLKTENNITGTYCFKDPSSLPDGINYIHHDVLNGELTVDQLPEKIDGLVYCPGAIDLKPVSRITQDEVIDDLKLQVVGAFNAVQKVLPLLKKSEQASIVFISTVAVQKGFAFHSKVAMSKGALEGLTHALSAELAPSIRVNCVAPSLTKTSLAGRLLNTPEKVEAHGKTHPLGRVGEPEDIADAIAFLLSDTSNWITGQVIHVDGGKSTIN